MRAFRGGNPLVSVAIPFTSTPARLLEGAVRSLFAQDYENWELWLLPDSDDPSLHAHLRRVTDSRVRLLDASGNRGLAHRLNQAARLARGPIMARMDADDVMHPERLSRLVRTLAAGPDLVGSRAYVMDRDSRIRGGFREPPLPASDAGYLHSNAFTHPTVAGLTSWFRKHPYDESLARSEDKELWLRTAGVSVFRKIDQRLLYYRIADLSPQKQRRDAQHDRRILRAYGPGLAGRPRTAALIARSHLKQAAFALAARGLPEERLLGAKVTALSAEEASRAERALRRALTQPVSGWGPVTDPSAGDDSGSAAP